MSSYGTAFNSTESIKKIDEILIVALTLGASDIHLQSGAGPRVRIRGEILPLPGFNFPLQNSELWAFVAASLSTKQREEFKNGKAVDINYKGTSHLGTFRLNASLAQGEIVITTRPICLEVPTFESLRLPPILKDISRIERGLVLVVGATGSGKSSTLAAMVDFINSTEKLHIVTIEDPIEFRFVNKKGLITQKEVGRDVPDFKSALRAALRQDPDVIMIGEMRDRETIDTALLAAETGHLVFATLHTLDAKETINRILASYEAGQQPQIRNQLSSILKAVVGQRLIPDKEGKGVIPAVEVMLTNERIREMISQPAKTRQISEAIEEGHNHYNMQTFDQSLMNLYSKGFITYEVALQNSSRPTDFELRCQGIETVDGEKFLDFDFSEKGQEHPLNQIWKPWKVRFSRPSRSRKPLRQSKDNPIFSFGVYVFSVSILMLLFWMIHKNPSVSVSQNSLGNGHVRVKLHP